MAFSFSLDKTYHPCWHMKFHHPHSSSHVLQSATPNMSGDLRRNISASLRANSLMLPRGDKLVPLAVTAPPPSRPHLHVESLLRGVTGRLHFSLSCAATRGQACPLGCDSTTSFSSSSPILLCCHAGTSLSPWM